jgi:hypothetical protein
MGRGVIFVAHSELFINELRTLHELIKKVIASNVGGGDCEGNVLSHKTPNVAAPYIMIDSLCRGVTYQLYLCTNKN